MTVKDIAEVTLAGAWETIGIEEALGTYKGEPMRCVECHGQMYPHRAYVDGARAHFEHKYAHLGCSTKPTFQPPKSMHPKAIK